MKKYIKPRDVSYRVVFLIEEEAFTKNRELPHHKNSTGKVINVMGQLIMDLGIWEGSGDIHMALDRYSEDYFPEYRKIINSEEGLVDLSKSSSVSGDNGELYGVAHDDIWIRLSRVLDFRED